jgi:hypothetical protein
MHTVLVAYPFLKVEIPENQTHHALLSSKQAGTPLVPLLIFLISLILRLYLLQGEQTEGRDVVPAHPFPAIVARDPTALFQASHDARERSWLDHLPCRLDDGLMQRRGRLWLIDQAGKHEEGRVREALLNVLLVLHMILPVIC